MRFLQDSLNSLDTQIVGQADWEANGEMFLGIIIHITDPIRTDITLVTDMQWTELRAWRLTGCPLLWTV